MKQQNSVLRRCLFACRSYIVLLSVAAATIASLALAFRLLNFPQPPTSRQETNHSISQPTAEGLSIPTYDDKGERSSLVKVAKCQRQQKRAGLLGLYSITIFDMSNVELDVRSSPDGSPPGQNAPRDELPKLVDSIKEIPRFLQWNDIHGFEICGLKVTIHDPSIGVTTIQAARSLPLPKGQLLLDGGVEITTDADASQLTTDQVIWWPHLGLFAVKGWYAFKNATGIERDRHKLFNVRLEPVTDAQEITRYEKRAMPTSPLATSD
jgi:hypothetical protein